jgi:hypothetical protein
MKIDVRPVPDLSETVTLFAVEPNEAVPYHL